MARRTVAISRDLALSADACWSVARRFCAPWHPAIDMMRSEAGGNMRAFTVRGESPLYKERLTWFSDSARMLRYTHVQGIAGLSRYDASFQVRATGSTPENIPGNNTPGGGGCTVDWQAEIVADDPARADAIAAGTAEIFEAGLAALPDAGGCLRAQDPPPSAVALPATRVLPTTPPVAVMTAGEGQDDTLCLFLHGIGGQKENWSAQVRAVAARMPAAAMDLRGYGGSALGPAPSTVAACCDDIRAVCAALGARRLVLCGLSYGAWIATSFAVRYPEKLAGLVLAGGCTGMSEAGRAEREAFLQSREEPLSRGQTPADFAPAVVDVIAGPHAGPELRAALAASMAAIPVQTYRDALQCFTHPPERFDFSRLTMPVLMMTGTFDKLAPPAEIRSVAERIWGLSPLPNVRFEEIPDAGHVCNLEQPDRVNRILLEFLEGVQP